MADRFRASRIRGVTCVSAEPFRIHPTGRVNDLGHIAPPNDAFFDGRAWYPATTVCFLQQPIALEPELGQVDLFSDSREV